MTKCKHSKIDFLILTIYAILISSILLINLLLAGRMDFSCKITFDHSNFFYLLFGVGVIVVGILMSKIIFKLFREKYLFATIQYSQSQMNKSVLCLSFIWAVVQLYLIYNYFFRTGWDVNFVLTTVEKATNGNPPEAWQNSYFSKYINNLFLVYIYSVIRKIDLSAGIIDVENGIMCFVFLQSFIFSVTAYLLYRIIYWFTKKQSSAWTGWIFYLTFIGLSPWFSIPYSNATGLLFPILTLYLYLRYLENAKNRYFFFISIVGYLGFKIKPQASIIFIAVIVSECIKFGQNIQYKNTKPSDIFKKIFYILFALTLTSGIVTTSIDSIGLQLSDKEKFGWQHFFMMGLNSDSNGVYNQDDVVYSESFPTKKERNAQNLEEAWHRIQDYGVDGLAKHLLKKTLTNTSDGTFAWGMEGNFYLEYYENRNHVVSPILKSIYYNDGSLHHYWKSFVQICWMTCLFGMTGVGLYATDTQKNTLFRTMTLGVIGLIIFELLFEARARYLFTFTPVFVILSIIGWSQLILLSKKWACNRLP